MGTCGQKMIDPLFINYFRKIKGGTMEEYSRRQRVPTREHEADDAGDEKRWKNDIQGAE